MPIKSIHFIRALCAFAALAVSAAAAAQAWPSKPVRIIVNFPPGGAADVIARAIAPGLGESLGQTVLIENRPGANGNIGAEAVVRAGGDGYTLLMASGGTVSVNPQIYTNMSFDPAKDLQPVAAAARVLVYLIVRPDVPANNVAELVTHLRANPGKLAFGSPGSGSSPHIAMEMFKMHAKVFAVHVPYRGAAPALTDLLGGQLQFIFDPGPGLTHVRSGKLRLLAVGSPKRSPQFPNTPTLAESGMPGFDADTYFGFYAPAAVSQENVVRLNREINRLLGTPQVRERIEALGGEPSPLNPAQFNEMTRVDRERFGVVIRAAGIKAD